MSISERDFKEVDNAGERQRLASDARYLLRVLNAVITFNDAYQPSVADVIKISCFLARSDKSITLARLQEAWKATR